jgi:putative membrane protein
VRVFDLDANAGYFSALISISQLPSLNAALNSLSAIFLITGYCFIKSKRVSAHRTCMLSAFGCSTLFLISYLVYHYQVGSVPFKGQGWIRTVYFAILITHTILAIAVVPLALMTLSRALKERFAAHRRIARWTFPVWLYVSVTGVVVYVMLYKL